MLYFIGIGLSDEKDITKWNNRRREHPNEDIFLEGADLTNLHLNSIEIDFLTKDRLH